MGRHLVWPDYLARFNIFKVVFWREVVAHEVRGGEGYQGVANKSGRNLKKVLVLE